ncbi:hypothetical protein E1287_07255 [Actinomadura sp. KC06]|uniref:hypothetical protein n=1 Tax=Actinomadura sp. KC06 TaxID=2530369 RepID=UPI00104EAFAF|nr:hypothetical protein [Actinomadura sp. KC06]TDD37847.1 hypothetical protein E1287_07255 [Actinomadura sp. KC06]
MSDLTIPPSAAALDDRADVGGGLCPLCKVCADHQISHTCIVQPGPLSDEIFSHVPHSEFQPLHARLAAHPARPLDENGERRGVDRTWCVCGCTTARKELDR